MATIPDANDALINENFMAHRTAPIFYQHSTQVDGPIASGTFFRVGQRMFFVTAFHTIDDGFLPENFIIPAKPNGHDDFIAMGKCLLITPEQKDYDACFLEILDAADKKKIAAGGWQFLSLDNVLDPNKAKDFVLFGFPYAIKDDGKPGTQYRSVSVYADRIPPPEDYPDKVPEIDLFFEYGTIAADFYGNEIEAPRLSGASGASIWALPPKSALWMPPRVVGVQTRFLKGNYFRGVDWRVVAKLLWFTDEALANEILERFDTNV